MSKTGGTSALGSIAVRRTAVRSTAVRSTAVRSTAVRSTRRANRLLAGFAVLAAAFVLVASRVHVNASWSDDAWGYLLLPIGTPRKGDIVIFEPPWALGASAPYLKRVLGVPGERVTVDGAGRVAVGGEPGGRAKPFALDGRALEPIAPVTIPAAHYYLLGPHVDSHDSRYAEVGLVPRARILGRALALPDVAWLGLEGPLVQAPCGSCGQQAPCGGQSDPLPACESGWAP